MKKLLTLSLVLSSFLLSDVRAQSSEMGLMLGFSSYKGDITESMFDSRFFHPAVGIMYRRSFTNHWAGKISLNLGRISGDDSRIDDDFKKIRNLHFRSSLLELSGQLEFNFFPYQTANNKTYGTPFVFIGLSVFRFQPKAELADEWYKLQPQSTEGQGTSAYPDRDPYNLTQVSVPFGGGVKFRLAKRVGMTIDGGARRTWTDYLDDISTTYVDKDVLLAEKGIISALLSDRSTTLTSDANVNRQRGNASDNDWYFFGGVTVSFTLSKKYNDSCKPFRLKFK
ncbi:MAG: hypothetical protein HKN22_01970 [Bacteroidia bacterium]|nr:hypothetical protein [Bacteroidia bacterium]